VRGLSALALERIGAENAALLLRFPFFPRILFSDDALVPSLSWQILASADNRRGDVSFFAGTPLAMGAALRHLQAVRFD